MLCFKFQTVHRYFCKSYFTLFFLLDVKTNFHCLIFLLIDLHFLSAMAGLLANLGGNPLNTPVGQKIGELYITNIILNKMLIFRICD